VLNLNQNIYCIENCLVGNLVSIVKNSHQSKLKIPKLAYDFLCDYEFLEDEIDFVMYMQNQAVNLVAENSSLYNLENLGYKYYYSNGRSQFNYLVFELLNIYYNLLLKETRNTNCRILGITETYIEKAKKEYGFEYEKMI